MSRALLVLLLVGCARTRIPAPKLEAQPQSSINWDHVTCTEHSDKITCSYVARP